MSEMLTRVSPEDFDSMIGTEESTEYELRMPFGVDVMLVLPEEQTQPDHCGLATGEGDGEDEYPPRFDPTIEGSIEDLG